MIEVTERAADFMKQALDSVEERGGRCFRLQSNEQGPQLSVDVPHEDDKSFEYDGEVLLVADPETGEQCENRRIDFDQSQSQLVVTVTG